MGREIKLEREKVKRHLIWVKMPKTGVGVRKVWETCGRRVGLGRKCEGVRSGRDVRIGKLRGGIV